MLWGEILSLLYQNNINRSNVPLLVVIINKRDLAILRQIPLTYIFKFLLMHLLLLVFFPHLEGFLHLETWCSSLLHHYLNLSQFGGGQDKQSLDHTVNTQLK